MHSSFRIDISGDVGYAAYFLMASWPNPETAPQLEAGDGPLGILIELSPQALQDLRTTLRLVGAKNEDLAESAAALLRQVERHVVPDYPQNGCGQLAVGDARSRASAG